MKTLTITYDGITLFDGEVSEMTWTDAANTVRVEGKQRGGGLGDLITGLSKQSTQKKIAEKREQYEAEHTNDA